MRTLALILAALMLAACSPSEPSPVATPGAAQADPPKPTAEPAKETDPDAIDCQRVGDLASDLVTRKAAGLTEREALAELSARGDFRLGFVVDRVFKPGASDALARADIMQTCAHVAKTGSTY